MALAERLLARNLEGLSDERAVVARQAVPEHRAIAEAHERYFVEQQEARLPAVEAPTGRALVDDDFVDVTWTVSHPDDWAVSSPSARRQHRLLRLAEQAATQGALPRVIDLAGVLGVSERTVKRDLSKLRSEGHRPQTRGAGEGFS